MASNILHKFTSFLGFQAAAKLPPIDEAKVPNKQQGRASHSRVTKTTSGDQRLTDTDRQTANLDLLTLRTAGTTKETIRQLSKVSPDLSASVWAYTRLVVTKDFKAVAYTQDGFADPAATQSLQQVLARMTYLTDYAAGFANVTGIHAAAEAMVRELRMYGSCSQELVLDRARMPLRLQPVSTTQLVWMESKDGSLYPVQRTTGGDIVLDTPAFFYEALDQDLLTAYSDSPMESALAATLSDAEFSQDVRRVIKRALHPRMDVTIDQDKFKKTIPPDLMGDPDRLREYQDNYIGDIESAVNDLEPDDALVHFDTTKIGYLTTGNSSLDREYEVLRSMIDSKLATGTKSPPSVLGHGSGSQNVASTESMLFLKYAEGLQIKVNSIMSRALTLALRLMGHDVFVKFSFSEIDLRPKSELEAFKSMEQSRVLEQLSLGLITDDEACIALTGKLPPPGYRPLSGTFFKSGSSDPSSVDLASAQSTTGAVQQSLTSDAPKAPKGNPNQAPIRRVQ